MPKTFLFDLDMTLVDTSAVAELRNLRLWDEVARNHHLLRPFTTHSGSTAPHELPAALKLAGATVGVVTNSPRRYAEPILQLFRIPYDVLVCWEDTEGHKPDPEPITLALQRLGIQPGPEVFYIGDDAADVEAAYHAGIVSIGVRWGPTTVFGMSSTAPDIFIAKPERLLADGDLLALGYLGERIAAQLPSRRHWGSLLPSEEQPLVHSIGRYFTRSDPRCADHPLTNAILSLKNQDDWAPLIGEAVGRAINKLDWQPNYIVPVPPKPEQARNRFEQILIKASEYFSDDIGYKLTGLKRVKDVPEYKSLGPLERREAISGAYASDWNWKNNNILLVDDVYTTGSTSEDCIRALKASGAGEVRVLVLGKDQRVFSRRTCSACGRSMRVRERKSDHKKFWGCSGYPNSCSNTEDF